MNTTSTFQVDTTHFVNAWGVEPPAGGYYWVFEIVDADTSAVLETIESEWSPYSAAKKAVADHVKNNYPADDQPIVKLLG